MSNLICTHSLFEYWHLRGKKKVKLEDTVQVGKDYCEHCDGDFWTLAGEFKSLVV